MLQRSSDTRRKRLDKIVLARSTQNGVNGADSPGLELSESAPWDELVKSYYANAAIDDLDEHQPETLAALVSRHLALAHKRSENNTNIKILTPGGKDSIPESPYIYILLVNEDRPFLVDSATLILTQQGFSLRWTVHPIFQIERDKNGTLLRIQPRNGKHDESSSIESFILMEASGDYDTARLQTLEHALTESFADVRASNNDWHAMRQEIFTVLNELNSQEIDLPEENIEESRIFLRWLAQDHFTFLGFREYRLDDSNDQLQLKAKASTSLGICRRRPAKTRTPENTNLAHAIAQQVATPELLLITKANARATIHRAAYLDYIGVKTFDESGKRVIGEKRFLGLFTSSVYNQNPQEIPLLRLKIQQVIEGSHLPNRSHASKELLHILLSLPRDELFQMSVAELANTAEEILSLQERQRVKVIIRRDAFDRFYSVLVFVPKEKYSSAVRHTIEALLMERLHGTQVESNVDISESNLARFHSLVHINPHAKQQPARTHELENEVRLLVRTWQDQLRDELLNKHDVAAGAHLFSRYADGFPASYRDDIKPKEALDDIARIEELLNTHSTLGTHLYSPHDISTGNIGLCIYHRSSPLPLADVTPILDSMGLRTFSERPYRLKVADQQVWLYDFHLQTGSELPGIDPEVLQKTFAENFHAIWNRVVPSDRFNTLTISAQLSWQQIRLLRTYARYLLQIGIPFSQNYMEEVVGRHFALARQTVAYFEHKFLPGLRAVQREKTLLLLEEDIDSALNKIESVDDDRILRTLFSMVQATTRTNYYQITPAGTSKPYLSMKFDPSAIPNLPAPRPMFEIFVFGAHVEGVHLRGGKIARGGIRWSDRREDFRTEVLALMKAQMVKNTLIVPVGAKGGFVCKQLPAGVDRDAVMKEVVRCYQDFVRGLLDLTDNYAGDQLIHPASVICYDDEDPYLVVAADKGTASFSDIANAVAAEYDFWLGDAFASGGSAGYDHKKLGITAKGGWEAVKRHFRELGLDVQRDPLTVIGIGDMSGDVFGNGMLRSPCTTLQAAFNHQHIFIDPNPDPSISFTERARLFALPRSTWADYDSKLLSAGGGVYSRQAKTVPLSAEARLMLGFEADAPTPNEVIQAILKLPVDLLWNGGIGTYVKASHETHAEVGDRTNDAVRIDAKQLRCRVVAEGGNLGFTQRARIEFATQGGRINTDFVDNSAGVDCSDHEVNIKILCHDAIQQKRITVKQRNELLQRMSDEVEQLVLRDNYLQTQAISTIESHAAERSNEYGDLIRLLERSGELNRSLEYLPDNEELRERSQKGRGLTRPELAVLIAYAKISLYNALLPSSIPEDPYLAPELKNYFPKPLQESLADLMNHHRLRRQIIITQVTNSLVNRMGPSFVRRTMSETGASAEQIARAYTIARQIFDARGLWAEIEQLDSQVEAAAQYAMYGQIARLLRHAALWFLAKKPALDHLSQWIDRYAPGISTLRKQLPQLVIGSELQQLNEATLAHQNLGVPPRLAGNMAGLHLLYAGLDITDVATETEHTVENTAKVYFEIEAGLHIDWLRKTIEQLSAHGQWQAMARSSLRDSLYDLQRQISVQILRQSKKTTPAAAVSLWLQANVTRIQRIQSYFAELQTLPNPDFATVSVALQELRKLTLN